MSFTVEGTPLEGVSALQATLTYSKFDTISLILDNTLWMQSVPCNINQEYYLGKSIYFIFTEFHTELLVHSQATHEILRNDSNQPLSLSVSVLPHSKIREIIKISQWQLEIQQLCLKLGPFVKFSIWIHLPIILFLELRLTAKFHL